MKTKLIKILTVSFISFFASTVLFVNPTQAEETTPPPTQTISPTPTRKNAITRIPVMEKLNEKRNEREESTITRLKAKGEKEIERRINSLTKLISQINNIKKLSSANKTRLANEVQEEIDNLKELQAKIKASTNLSTLRTDVQSIARSYRIYALYMPRVRIIVGADLVLDNAETRSSRLVTNAERIINKLKEKGINTTTLETDLAEVKANFENAKTEAQEVIDMVINLKPDGTNHQPKLQEARKKLADIYKSLKTPLGEFVKDAKVLREQYR